MTPELQAPVVGSQHAHEPDPVVERISGELETTATTSADGNLASQVVDRPPRGRGLEAFPVGAAAGQAWLELSPAQVDQLAALFKLLSDKTRLAILQMLCEGEINVSSLCRRLSLPQPTVSHHLGLLRMNRLITSRRNGKEVHYRLHERIARPESRVQGGIDRFESDGFAAGRRASGLQISESGFCVQISEAAGGA